MTDSGMMGHSSFAPPNPLPPMHIEFNNASALDTKGTGWFVGFSEWAKANEPGVFDLRYLPREMRSHSLCMKWMAHPKGDPRGGSKPPSEGRTLSILVSESGRFRLQFCEHPEFAVGQVVEYALDRHGQFVVWGEGLYHRWFVDADCTILTLRWVPEAAAATEV